MALITSPDTSYQQTFLSGWRVTRTADTSCHDEREFQAANKSVAVDVAFGRFALIGLLATTLAILAAGTIARAQVDGRVVATVNGREITQRDLDRLVVGQTFPLEQKVYAIRKATLENLITLRVLESEAKRRGVTVAEVRKELATGEVHVTPQQVEDAYATNASFFGNMSPDEAKERLRLDLENQQRMQNYRVRLAKLKQTASIEVRLMQPHVLSTGDEVASPSLGPADAAVTIVEFSDFQCPYCRKVQSTIKQLLQTYEKDVRFIFKHLPLDIHQGAFPAAQAAFCAGQQGLFWQYHDALFNAETYGIESLKRIAEDLGVNISLFTLCLTSPPSRNAISLNIWEAGQLGISSTPTFVINGKLVSGALAFEEFKKIIDQELTAANHIQNSQSQPARKD